MATVQEALKEWMNVSGYWVATPDPDEAKADVFKILDGAAAEVPALLAALRAGRIDGEMTDGPCRCLVGTIAAVRGCTYDDLKGDQYRPAEEWFLGIAEGAAPSNSPLAAVTEGWILEWARLRGVAL